MMYNLKVQAKAGNPALLDAYKALSTTQEKDQFLMNWQLDKKKAALRAQETITRGKAHGSTKEDNWWTEHQLATRGGFGEAVAAMMVKDLPSRPSKYPSLAAAGIKEYYYVEEKSWQNTSVNQQAQINATSDEMDEEVFETVKAAMVAGMPGSSSTNTQNKRPRPQPKQKALPGTEGEPKIEDPTKVEASFNKLINDSRKIYHRQSLEDQDQEWKKAMLEKWQTAAAGLELAFKDFQKKCHHSRQGPGEGGASLPNS